MHSPLLSLAALLLPLAAAAQTGQNVNHALTGIATQCADHPTYPAGVAGRLIDGNRNGAWADDSSNITAVQAAPWWQVALAGPRLVHEVVIYCRADANNTSCRDMLVELKAGGTTIWSQTTWTGGAFPIRGGHARILLPPGGLTVDTVRLSRPLETNGVISLAEVEVLEIAAITPVNWAIYGTATQAPDQLGHPASNAIDGNTDSYLSNNSTAWGGYGSSGQDWWEVSLRRRRYEEIRLWPSTYVPMTGTFYVRTFDGATTVGTYTLNGMPATGPAVVMLSGSQDIDRVRISRNSVFAPVTLAEVEVFNWSALDAEAKAYGSGCLGSAGVPRLRQSTPPVIDSNFDVVLTNVPASPGLALVLSGVSRTLYGALPLALDLGLAGAPGCQLLTSVELSQIAIASGGTATSTFAVPNNSALLTFELHQQAFVLDGGANALGGTLSNALRARLGL